MWSTRARVDGGQGGLLGAVPTRIRRSFTARGSAARPLATTLLFVVVIAGSMAAGAWQTRAEAGGGTGSGSGTSPAADAAIGSDHEGEALPLDGSADPAQVKGRMTVLEVVEAFRVDPPEVLAALGAPADTGPALSVKAVAGTYGGSVDDLRAWLASQSVAPVL